MKVRTLKRVLAKLDDEVEIVVDNDVDEGSFDVDCFELITDYDEEKILNIVTSHERS